MRFSDPIYSATIQAERLIIEALGVGESEYLMDQARFKLRRDLHKVVQSLAQEVSTQRVMSTLRLGTKP